MRDFKWGTTWIFTPRGIKTARSQNQIFPESPSLLSKLRSLKASKAPGPDGIHPAILHECSEILSVPLCIIFEKCLNSNFVPEDWRVANVTPIFKKGDRSLPCNYRPVSLTSVVCKVMESLIKDYLLKYLLDNGFLNLSQHGFLPSRSCVTNLLSFLDDVSLYQTFMYYDCNNLRKIY